MVPFYKMAFEVLFECKCPEEQMEGMFHLMDGDCSSELGFPEFVLFVAVVKARSGAGRKIQRCVFFSKVTIRAPHVGRFLNAVTRHACAPALCIVC
jgi:hypothetical protein